MTADIEIRPATAADIAAYYGSSVAPTVRAVVAVMDGKPVGIAGVKYERGALMAFSEIRNEMRPHRKAIVKGARMAVDMIRRIGAPVYAVGNLPTSDELLRHYGFERVGESRDGGVYQWQS